MLIVIVIMLSVCVLNVSASSPLLGDVDADNAVSVIDAALIQKSIARLSSISSERKTIADIDCDDDITILDATCIQKWLTDLDINYAVGKPINSIAPTEPVDNSSFVTVCGVTFDVRRIPRELIINDNNKEKANSLILIPQSEIDPYDISVVVNNGCYRDRVDYSDSRFKESYLMEKESDILHGYDCVVTDHSGNELAYVYAHYKGNLYYPFQTTIYGLFKAEGSFPIELYYKDQLIKKCIIHVQTSSGSEYVETTRCAISEIESECWTDSMSDKEKMKAFAEYIRSHYSYSQVMCVTGAVFTALAARDLGLDSLLLYPGGERNQHCDRHIVTYNIYQGTAVPGGHCACLVKYDDCTMRYDVQGGAYVIREYIP